MHCDKHCVKMILETAQLLSTAHRELDGNYWADKFGLYKSTHRTTHQLFGCGRALPTTGGLADCMFSLAWNTPSDTARLTSQWVWLHSCLYLQCGSIV